MAELKLKKLLAYHNISQRTLGMGVSMPACPLPPWQRLSISTIPLSRIPSQFGSFIAHEPLSFSHSLSADDQQRFDAFAPDDENDLPQHALPPWETWNWLAGL